MSDPTTETPQPTPDPALEPTAETPTAETPTAEPTPSAGAPGASSDDEVAQLRAQLAAEQQRREQLEAQVSRGAPATVASVDLSGDDQAERAKRYDDWPVEGGSDLPQPWDLRALGLQSASRDLDEQSAGAPDDVSPIVLDDVGPILTSGSADPSVHELGRALGVLGFDNSVSRGENPFGAVDQTVMNAVHAFRAAYGVEEDPSPYGGNTPAGRALAANHIGPWTREAIRRAAERQAKAA